MCSRVRLRLEKKNAHSTKGEVLNTDQPKLVISSLTTSKILKWADKNRAFWKFGVNFRGQKLIRFLWKWFSLKNIKLKDQLSLTSFLFLIIFKKLYLVNLCPIFVDPLQNLRDSWGKNSHLGLISDQDWCFSWMLKILIQS